MAFSFNFGAAESGEPSEGGIVGGSEKSDPASTSTATPPPSKRRRVGDTPIAMLSLTSARTATGASGGAVERSGQLVAMFEGGVTLRGVSSELAGYEIAAFHDDATAAAGAAGNGEHGQQDEQGGGVAAPADAAASVVAATPGGVVHAVALDTDLIPRVYEGGMKVWEGAGDLVNCLIRSGEALAGKTVLELGAGAGLPGLYAATVGAARVDFQDYNREVVEHLTIPNYLLNIPATHAAAGNPPRTDESEQLGQAAAVRATGEVAGSAANEAAASAASGVVVGGTSGAAVGGAAVAGVSPSPSGSAVQQAPRFFAGSWAALEDHIAETGGGAYDVVLTAETLYSLESMPELYSLLKATVARPHGVAFVASKVYYFGVGGGTQDFLKLVARDGHFRAKTVFESGGGVKREVIKLEVIS
jgi:hypothetical protein